MVCWLVGGKCVKEELSQINNRHFQTSNWTNTNNFSVNQNHPRRLRPSFRKFKIFNIFRSVKWLVLYLYFLIQLSPVTCAHKILIYSSVLICCLSWNIQSPLTRCAGGLPWHSWQRQRTRQQSWAGTVWTGVNWKKEKARFKRILSLIIQTGFNKETFLLSSSCWYSADCSRTS